MAGRYEDWHHRRGGNDRPDLVSVAKKLLGYLEEQRRLKPGVPTQAIERTLSDGSVVRAEFYGDVPRVSIRAASQGGGRAPIWFDGFAIRPTTSAQSTRTWTGGARGTGAFEQANYRLQVLLARPTAISRQGLVPAWYDSNPLWWPDDPAPGRFYRPDLGEPSFRYAANLDWQGTAGALYFFGPNIRSGTDFWFQFDRYVLHNGVVLLDLDETSGVVFSVSGPDTVYVMGAALVGTMGNPSELRVVVGERDDPDSLEMTIRVVSAALFRVGNSLVTEKDEDGYTVLVDLGNYVITHMSGQTACVFFNQRGDEARTLMPRFDDTDSEITRYTEIVATWDPADEIFVFVADDHAVAVEESTKSITTSGTIGMAVGGIETEYGSNVFPDSGSGITDIAGTTTETIEYADNGWFKISVDYRDNVPVYLERRRKAGVRESTTVFNRTVIATDPGNSPSVPGTPVQLLYDPGQYAKWFVGGGYLNGEPWAPSGTVEAEATVTVSQEYTSSYRTDFLQLNEVQAENTTITYTQEITATGNYFGTEVNIEQRDQTIDEVTIRPLYIDLRNRLWTYQRKQYEVANGSTTTVTRDYGTTGDQSGFTKRTQFVGPSTTTTTYNTVFTCNGVAVEDTQTEQSSTSSSNSDVTVTPAAGWGYWWTEPSMYTRLVGGLGGAREAGYSLPTTPYLSDAEYVIPGTNWAFYSNEFALVRVKWSIGSWVASRNLVAYSYPTRTAGGGIVVANGNHTAVRADFIGGLCTLDGIKFSSGFDSYIYDEDQEKVRHFPIMAISPFKA